MFSKGCAVRRGGLHVVLPLLFSSTVVAQFWGDEGPEPTKAPAWGTVSTGIDTSASSFEVADQESCTGSQTEWGPCPKPATCAECSPINCVVGDWVEWSDCDCSGLKVRSRAVAAHNNECGTPCDAVLEESTRCEDVKCRDCELSHWSTWSVCANNQQYRSRRVVTSARNGGKSCDGLTLKELADCGELPITPVTQDAIVSPWSDWGACTVTCGEGQTTRYRVVVQQAASGGVPYKGDLSETELCPESMSPACEGNVDCQWDEWAEWSDCSCTCGGGQKTRSRQIVTSPKGLGLLCSASDKLEIAACAVQSCAGTSQDGVWDQWGEWSSCTSSCDGGTQLRSRQVITPAANGGTPAEGLLEEFRPCNTQMCTSDSNCIFNDWVAWSACSCTCNGVMHRTRSVATYGTGTGLACEGPTHQVQPCNFGPEMAGKCGEVNADCLLSQWTEWGACATTCGAGERQRSRKIISPALGQGAPCSGALVLLDDCVGAPCQVPGVIDCVWGDWAPWSKCDTCTLQTRRFRLIKAMPENGGLACAKEMAEEIQACPDVTERTCGGKAFWCLWSEWGPWDESSCNGPCGMNPVRKRNRHIYVTEEPPEGGAGFFAQVRSEEGCRGLSQHDEQLCPNINECPAKKAINCEVGDWAPWASCDCTGLQTRQREVLVENNHLGIPCQADLVETQKCPPTCRKPPTNCVLGDWGEWTTEAGKVPHALDQKVRIRMVVQEASNGGIPCEGTLTETVPVGGVQAPSTPVDCVLTMWSQWSDCSVTCGAGTRHKTRSVSVESSMGGRQCEGQLEIVGDCDLKSCEGDLECIWGVWSEWSACTRSCDGGQTRRTRQIKQYPTGTAPLCEPHALSEIRACATQKCGKCIDGVWSPWNEWSTCSQKCGGGVRSRTRNVDSEASACGRPVTGDFSEWQECNVQGCSMDKDCEWGEWGAWSDCSCTCNGVMHRTRSIKHYGSGVTGAFCEGSVHDIAPCMSGASLPPQCETPSTDCLVGEWLAWGPCSATCGSGQYQRERHIIQQATGGGDACPPGAMKELGACQADYPCQAEKSIDCMWSEWGEWGHCDKCGGQKRRFRYITQMPENGGSDCGVQAVKSEETSACPRRCTDETFCTWTLWGEWDSCPVTCHAHSRMRSRHLMVTTSEPWNSPAKFSMLKVDTESIQTWFNNTSRLSAIMIVMSLIFLYQTWVYRRQEAEALQGTSSATPREYVVHRSERYVQVNQARE